MVRLARLEDAVPVAVAVSPLAVSTDTPVVFATVALAGDAASVVATKADAAKAPSPARGTTPTRRWTGSRRLPSGGAIVLIGDPRRSYLPLDRMDCVIEYSAPVTRGVFRFR